MTSSSHTYDTIVIGGGFGGMAAASLRALTDPSVLLLEHHSYLGGCASYFKRSEFTFDVGATTISGIGDNRPLSEWLNLIDLPLSLQKIDPGIVVHNSHKKFLGFTDAALWNQQMREWGATEKEIKFFSKGTGLDGFNIWCKNCQNEYSKDNYNLNKDRLKPIRKNWKSVNNDKIKKYNKDRYESTDKERLSNLYGSKKDEIKLKRDEYRKTEEYKKWLSDYRKFGFKNTSFHDSFS
jgi:phytoene dehydrogenase-like protein